MIRSERYAIMQCSLQFAFRILVVGGIFGPLFLGASWSIEGDLCFRLSLRLNLRVYEELRTG